MLRKKTNKIKNQYKYQKDGNAYLIEINLHSYDDIYDEMDMASFNKRFIDSEVDEFITSSSEDIPIKNNINVIINFTDEKKNPDKEKAILAAYKNYYSYMLEKIREEKAKKRKTSYYYFFLGAVFIIVANLVLHIAKLVRSEMNNVLLQTIGEVIIIGGWVVIWEGFDYAFIANRDINEDYKIIKRLHISEVKFTYPKL